MGFFSFLVLLVIAYLLWRVTDQLPDLIFRLSEIQRDIAEIRRRLTSDDASSSSAGTATPSTAQSGDASADPAAGTATTTSEGG